MASKTWFLTPDFSFLPDGQIALGNVIPEPQRPTATLASLNDHQNIPRPDIRSIEENCGFSAAKSRAFELGLFAKLLDVARASVKTNGSWHRNMSIGTVNHELLAYNGDFTTETLRAIVALDKVKRHIDSVWPLKRCVYIISGLRVAKESLTITNDNGKKVVASLCGQVPVPPADALPVALGGNISGSMEENRENSYKTAPGIVFAYRLHVIRPKRATMEGELVSSKAAFCSGEYEDEEMEFVEVDGAVLEQDPYMNPKSYREERIEGHDESYIMFGSVTGEKSG